MNEQILPRKRGRPIGSKNGTGTALAPIVNWTPKHELVVQLSLANWDAKDIAEEVGLTPTRVSQILQDPRAKKTRNAVIEKIRERMGENLEEQLANLRQTALDQLSLTVCAPFDVGTRAKIHQDNVCLDLLKGHLKGDESKGDSSGDKVPVELLDKIVSAMDRSNEAKRLNSGQVIEAKIINENVA